MIDQIVTIPVRANLNGKIEGIRGLYKDPRNGRLYVRFAFRGVDRQKTIHVKKETFSELRAAASSAMSSLKKEVMALVCDKSAPEKPPKNTEQLSQERLRVEILRLLQAKGRSKKYVQEVVHTCSGLCLCQSRNRSEISRFDAINVDAVDKILNDPDTSDIVKHKKYHFINNVFSQLIAAGTHTGINPTRKYAAPRAPRCHRNVTLTFEEDALIIAAIRALSFDPQRRMESELFFRMCVETGQRPSDVFIFDPAKIEPDGEHYAFYSGKTRREQRVMHILSPAVRDLMNRVILARGGCVYRRGGESSRTFWTFSLKSISKDLNDTIKQAVGDNKILYATRHFFITEIFRRTESTFWAEAFTHEGRTVAQCHYLHPDQSRADEILKQFCADFQAEVDKQSK